MCWFKFISVVIYLYVGVFDFKVVNGDTAMDKLDASSYGEQLKTVDSANRDLMQSILPTLDFWDFFTNRTDIKRNILLVDVDKNSAVLLLNQVIALRKTGSDLANHVYAIAYDEFTCGKLVSAGLSCYYNASWQKRLFLRYKEQTYQDAHQIQVVMMGRMMTTTVALCEGHNVFLTDTDVVYYRNPLDYAFHEAGIMITATSLPTEYEDWGGRFFEDIRTQAFTLNNGVVFYRSNTVIRSFTLTLVIHSVRRLKWNSDPLQGFLQLAFNQIMSDNKLVLHSAKKISDPNTYRLNSTHMHNSVGECYDCYYGHIPWTSEVVRSSSVPGHHEILKIGVFPLKRYTSFCASYTGMHEALVEASHALRNNDTTHWEWGALPNNGSRILFTHSNCLYFSGTSEERFKIKSDWFRKSNSWFL